MINIKKNFYKVGRILYKMALVFGALIIVMFPIYLTALWIESDYNPDFLKMDSCYDKGGAWHNKANDCYYMDEQQADFDRIFHPEDKR